MDYHDEIKETIKRNQYKTGSLNSVIFKNGCMIFSKTGPKGNCGVQVNLAGLSDNLNFKLLSINKTIRITVGEKEFEDTIVGRVHDVGIDFIEIVNRHGRVNTILKDKIKVIELF